MWSLDRVGLNKEARLLKIPAIYLCTDCMGVLESQILPRGSEVLKFWRFDDLRSSSFEVSQYGTDAVDAVDFRSEAHFLQTGWETCSMLSIRVNTQILTTSRVRPPDLSLQRRLLEVLDVKSWRLYRVVSLNGDVISHLVPWSLERPSHLSQQSLSDSQLWHSVHSCALGPYLGTKSKAVHQVQTFARWALKTIRHFRWSLTRVYIAGLSPFVIASGILIHPLIHLWFQTFSGISYPVFHHRYSKSCLK
jgi:hypothetical protein